MRIPHCDPVCKDALHGGSVESQLSPSFKILLPKNSQEYRYVYFVLLFTLYVLILCSNCAIIWVIWIHRSLHEPMYVFIAALSLNSILFSTAIYPKLFVDVLSHQQTVYPSACMLQYFVFYTLAAADFYLLSAMAYDRYVSICKPLQYATRMDTTSVAVFLALAWFVPTCHVLVPTVVSIKQNMCHSTLVGIFCNNSIQKLFCVIPRFLTVWGLFALTNLTLLPVLFIAFTYIKILTVAYRSCGEVRKKAADTCLPHLMVLISFSCLCAFDVIIARLEGELSKSLRLMMSLQIIMYNPLFNPIIYGVKMKEIWKHIKRLLILC
ncbi:olfactory receptor 6N2-like [Syngnathoides biaculeatus]|uniref:olfactory receptor 6N2-like n=1 Tax=Syngnathoides biaculeatus TaxID=300417 RepID=UPI002ADE47D2|nr:olfactory receptor 6N2-like [Syngnathoides biaculeatus]